MIERRLTDCPICQKADLVRIGRINNTYEAWRCRNCRSAFGNPLSIFENFAEWDSFNSSYYFQENLLSEARFQKYQERWEGLWRAIKPSSVTVGKLLDVGCGSGELLRVAKVDGWEVYGLEASKPLADYLNKQYLLKVLFHPHFFLAAGGGIPFAGDFFDLVATSHVLEHLYDPFSVLVEIRRVLKKDGRLYLAVPNFENWELQLRRLLKRREQFYTNLNPPMHLFDFCPKSLQFILKKVGLTPLMMKTVKVGSFPYTIPRGEDDPALKYRFHKPFEVIRWLGQFFGGGEYLVTIAGKI